MGTILHLCAVYSKHNENIHKTKRKEKREDVMLYCSKVLYASVHCRQQCFNGCRCMCL